MPTTHHDDLLAASWQTQATYDRKRAYVERCVRYLDDCPDGHPRKAEAEQRVRRALRDMHAAERAAGEAADALLEYEDTHTTPTESGR